jgi:TolB-like protein
MDVSEKASVYEFSGFRLDAAHRKLLSPEGKPIPLTSRVFDTLLYLVQHQGELVDKATLMQAVWPGAVVEENNLNQAITSLRKALGEKRGEHRFILTDPGRGYRFVAEVTGAVPGTTTSTGKATELLPNSVAVLPFENLSDKPEDAYFAAGIHDEIINRLARIRDLSVIARTSVAQYAGAGRSIPEIAAELRVQAILEGSVRYADNRVRVTVQLVDGTSGKQIWSEAYSHDLKDVFDIQTDIATSIASSLEVELMPAERARIEKPPTDSPAAYALFLEAMDLSNRAKVRESIAVLDRAITIDPEFALAYAQKAYQGAWSMVNSAMAAPGDPSTLQKIETSVRKEIDLAMALDDGLGEAWLAKGTFNRLTWHWREAGKDYARAMALSPNDAKVLSQYAGYKLDTRDYGEAMRLGKQVALLNPKDIFSYQILSVIAFHTGRHDEGFVYAQRECELAPGDAFGSLLVSYFHNVRGEFDTGERYLRTAESLITDDTGQYMLQLIHGYMQLGLEEEAKRIFRKYQVWSETHGVGAGDWAAAYLALGDQETAYQWFARAIEHAAEHKPDAGYHALVLLKNNILRDPVLEQPRFRALRDRLDAVAMSD